MPPVKAIVAMAKARGIDVILDSAQAVGHLPFTVEETGADFIGFSLHKWLAAPLGTGGAIKFASTGINDAIVVFNGDVLTEIDLASVIRLHRERQAKATIVLTPVENPTAYGLVETDAAGNIQRFVEKPKADHHQDDPSGRGRFRHQF